MPYWLPEDMEHTLEMHRRSMRGEAPPDGFEIRFCRRSGEVFWALVYEAPLIDAFGRQTGWMASVLDVTERKRAAELARQQEQRMQHTARLVSMGEMASTLAHELNQPLSAIASYNAGCLNRLASGDYSSEELAGALSKLGAQAQRAGQIIRRVHDFVRKSEPKLARCRAGALAAEALAFVEADAAKRGILLRLDGGDAIEVMADRILMVQALLNLIRNGIEAMSEAPAGRRLTVSVAARGTEAEIAVADSGAGVAADALSHLFDPFFTTKREGMGMGLNICRSIVEFHQGRLWHEANPEGGSIFRLTLPLAAP
jgi:two-component system sensor histidine kinase DctS